LPVFGASSGTIDAIVLTLLSLLVLFVCAGTSTTMPRGNAGYDKQRQQLIKKLRESESSVPINVMSIFSSRAAIRLVRRNGVAKMKKIFEERGINGQFSLLVERVETEDLPAAWEAEKKEWEERGWDTKHMGDPPTTDGYRLIDGGHRTRALKQLRVEYFADGRQDEFKEEGLDKVCNIH
jgi:hypothetical protein